MKPIDLQRPRDLGKILDDSFALYRAHWRTLLLVSLAVVVPVHLIVFGAGLGWLTAGYETPPAPEDVKLADLTDQLTGLAAQLLVVTPLVTAMAVHVVQRAAEGSRATAGEALSAGLAVFGSLFGAVLLVAAGVALGLLALVIPGVILAIRWVVVSQVVVLEGRSGTDALRRSFELTRGQGWFTFLVVLVMNLLIGFLTLLFTLPLDAAAKEADAQAFSMLGQALGAVLSLPILAVAYTLLYHTLRVQKEGGTAGPTAGTPAPVETATPEPAAPQGPSSLPGVPGTYGDGFRPPTPPGPAPEHTS